MQITDAIADMLTRIRNASSAKHESVDIPASNLKSQLQVYYWKKVILKNMEDNR